MRAFVSAAWRNTEKSFCTFSAFIVSNCQAGYIRVFLRATGFGHFFKGHLCPGDTGMAKAENIMKIRDDFDLKDPVYVGDTLGDFNDLP